MSQREKRRASRRGALWESALDYSNLGIAQQNQGRLAESEASLRHALKLRPEFEGAHNLLGNVLRDQGRPEEAELSFRRALELKPGFPEAHIGLGNVLCDQGRWEEAESSYRRALKLKPDYALAHSNLGFALQNVGRWDDALMCARTAIALKPQNDLFWTNLEHRLEPLTFDSVDDDLYSDLVRLLERPNVRPDVVRRAVISALRCHRDFSRILECSLGAETELVYAELAAQLSSIPLLLLIMGLSSIDDLEVEGMLTSLRRAMVQELLAGKDNDNCLPFSAALALNCFVNEYVFWETPEETAAVERLQEDLANLVQTARDVPPARLIALGAYRPLHRFPWAENLLNREWAGEVEQVITRQILEPIEENLLRPEIRRLTSIHDTISVAVRAQYEENPYPRWIKTSIGGKAETIGAALRGSPLRLELGDYESPESPEILIAGCGTGRFGVETTSRFLNSRALAVDLSLSSLAYAARKTRELGLSNIEYAQADIMELGGFGRQFDLVECAGVLHHLGDPLAGWRILVNLLRPGGLMRVGLYSETARQPIVNARSIIAERGYSTSSEDIRRFRHDFVKMVGDPEVLKVVRRRSFFNLSECRDLLFHVQEHRFTLPQIEAALRSLKLKFLGFEFSAQGPVREFAETHTDNGALTTLALWHEFELENPETFAGMYQFWCRKM